MVGKATGALTAPDSCRGVQSHGHGFNYFPPDPEWAHKHLSPQMPFKCSIARVRWQPGPTVWLFFFTSAAAESGKPLLKELQQATSKQQEAVLNSVYYLFFGLEFLFKPSQVLCGVS